MDDVDVLPVCDFGRISDNSIQGINSPSLPRRIVIAPHRDVVQERRDTRSSAVFNALSVSDDSRFSIPDDFRPVSRDSVVTQPRRTESRNVFSQNGDRESSLTSDFSFANSFEPAFFQPFPSRPLTSSSRPSSSSLRRYVASGRVHATPNFEDKHIRSDSFVGANRLFQIHTTGAEAQVPLAFRPGSSSSSQLCFPKSSVVIPVIPVRGSVVLPSSRTLPKPPQNAVRTRAPGELLYSGPCHLLRERARALKDAETLNPVDLRPNEHSYDAARLIFTSAFGTPIITNVNSMAEAYGKKAVIRIEKGNNLPRDKLRSRKVKGVDRPRFPIN
jgi:hypothetical protein